MWAWPLACGCASGHALAPPHHYLTNATLVCDLSYIKSAVILSNFDGDIFRDLQMGIQKWYFLHNLHNTATLRGTRALILYRRRRFINHLLTYLLTSVDIVYIADGRRLPCVLNNIHRGHGSVDIVHRAYTVYRLEAYNQRRRCCRWKGGRVLHIVLTAPPPLSGMRVADALVF